MPIYQLQKYMKMDTDIFSWLIRIQPILLYCGSKVKNRNQLLGSMLQAFWKTFFKKAFVSPKDYIFSELC